MRPSAANPSGVVHDNTRHTTRFTVIGNHLAQHRELSLLAIGLAVHIQSLPTGARVDIKTLAHRFPEGATRIAAALRELETHGYLRRVRERAPTGRIITRTTSCNQPTAPRHRTMPTRSTRPQAPPIPTAHTPAANENSTTPRQRPAPGKKRPLPTVPQPAYPSPTLLRTATDLLSDLHRHNPHLLLSARDTAHLAPGVAAWLERDITLTAVRHALTTDLPTDGVRHPAALLTHRLTARLPPPPPFRSPPAPPPVPHPLRNCDGCDRAFRAPEPGLCGDCRAVVPAPPPASPATHSDEPPHPLLRSGTTSAFWATTEQDLHSHARDPMPQQSPTADLARALPGGHHEH